VENRIGVAAKKIEAAVGQKHWRWAVKTVRHWTATEREAVVVVEGTETAVCGGGNNDNGICTHWRHRG